MASQGPTTGVAATSVVEVGDGANPTQQAAVDPTGAVKTQSENVSFSGLARQLLNRTDDSGRFADANTEMFALILTELRVVSAILAIGFGISEDLDALRRDATVSPDDFTSTGAI